MPKPTREKEISREAVDFVTELLILCPSDLSVEKKTVFTTSPWIWEWSGHTNEIEIVDVGSLFGVSGALFPDGRQVAGHVIDHLAAAGWDRALIQTEYRPSPKSNDRLDIACLNPLGDEARAIACRVEWSNDC